MTPHHLFWTHPETAKITRIWGIAPAVGIMNGVGGSAWWKSREVVWPTNWGQSCSPNTTLQPHHLTGRLGHPTTVLARPLQWSLVIPRPAALAVNFVILSLPRLLVPTSSGSSVLGRRGCAEVIFQHLCVNLMENPAAYCTTPRATCARAAVACVVGSH